jgi:hypothetical protein
MKIVNTATACSTTALNAQLLQVLALSHKDSSSSYVTTGAKHASGAVSCSPSAVHAWRQRFVDHPKDALDTEGLEAKLWSAAASFPLS